MQKKIDIKKITVTAVFCALAYLCMFVFRFKVSFLTFDFKDAVLSVVAFMFGPVYGVCASAIVAFMEFITVSDTGVYGLIMNFLASATFTLVCGTVYKFRRSFSGAILSVIFAAISVTVVMLLANLFITPYYMGVGRGAVAAMIPTLLLPFNLCKTFINAAVSLLIYKPLTLGLKKTGLLVSSDAEKNSFNKKSLIVTICSLIVILVVILILIFVLHGNFELFAAKS